jgi:catechol 2,3-dioxygenase-like lactoylglutathione lyase family enzyme
VWGFITPQLPVTDIPATQAWYRDVRGFAVAGANDDFGAVSADRVEIFFRRVDTPGPSVTCCVRVEDADALCEAYRERGAKIVEEISDRPWGMREFTVEDPNGHLFRIGHAIESRSRWRLKP